jgi:hypothetical protein
MLLIREMRKDSIMPKTTVFRGTKLAGHSSENGEKTQSSFHKNGKTIQKNLLDITALIRSVQRAEGNFDCFGKCGDRCNRLDCAWYSYCVKLTDSFDN